MKKSGKRSEMDLGQGSASGTGQGQGMGYGGGQGRNNGGSFGTGGYCICTKCGEKVTHSRGVKCTKLKCPRCGHIMIREELVKNKK